MFKFLKTQKHYLFIFLLITFLYFILRIPNLTLQPIFADEAIYIRWAQVMKAEPTLRFLPLSDGKTPLFMWVMIPLFKIFEDPLFAGRILSVFSGFLTLLGVLFLGWKFFKPGVGLWAAYLIAITPFMVFFDRMALVDSLLAAFSLWSLILAMLVIKYQRIDLAMVLGYLIGGGLLTKTPGFFNVLVLPFTLIAFPWKDKNHRSGLVKLFILFGLAIFITLFIYNLLRLGPGFVNLSSRNQDYIFSPLELVGRPLDPFLPHFNDVKEWFSKLLTWPIMVFIFLGIIFALIKKEVNLLAVLLWALIPLIIEMAFLRTFTARYILSSIPVFLIIGAWGIYQVIQKVKLPYLLGSVLGIILLLPLTFNFNLRLLTNIESVDLPKNERRGYLEDWTAGYGFLEIAQYLIEQSEKGLIIVGTEGSFGTLPDGLLIYLDRHSHTAPKENQIIVIGGKATVSAELKEAALEHPTFFITNKSRFPIISPDLEIVKEYPKAKNWEKPQDAIQLFRVLKEDKIL